MSFGWQAETLVAGGGQKDDRVDRGAIRAATRRTLAKPARLRLGLARPARLRLGLARLAGVRLALLVVLVCLTVPGLGWGAPGGGATGAVRGGAAEPQPPRAGVLNRISAIRYRATGPRTTELIVEGSATPTFTVYRIFQPPRIVVDIANSQLGPIESPFDVELGAVSQVAALEHADPVSRVSRVMIGFRTKADYRVVTRGHSLVITVEALEPPPAPAAQAGEQTARARAEIARLRAQADGAQADRQKAALERERAQSERQHARTDWQRAQSERQRAETERQRAETERQRAQSERQRAETERQRAENERQRAENERLRAEALRKQAEEERRQALAEAQKLDGELRAQAHAVVAQAEKELAFAREKASRLAQSAELAARKRAEALLRQAQAELLRAQRARAEEEARAKRAAALRVQEEARARSAQVAWEQTESRRRQLQASQVEAEVRRRAAEAARHEEEKRIAALRAAQKREEQLARTAADAVAQKTTLATSEVARRQAELREVQAEVARQDAARRAAVRARQQAEAELARIDASRRAVREALSRDEAALKRAEEALAQVEAQRRAALAKAQSRLGQQGLLASAGPDVPVGGGEATSAGASKPKAPAAALPEARVTDVQVLDRADRLDVLIETNRPVPHTLVAASEKSVILELRHVQLPRILERSLDATALGGPIKLVSSFHTPNEPGVVRVVVDLEQSVRHRVRRQGNRLYWSFPKSPGARSEASADAEPAAPSVDYPRSRVAGIQTPVAAQLGPPPRPRRPRRYVGRRIEVDFKDADIHNILRLLADVGQVNIVTSDDVKGSVTIRMRNVPWDQALDVILRSRGLGQVSEGNIIRVAPLSVLEKERELEIARKKQITELKPLQTRIIRVSYADATKMLQNVKQLLSPRGTVTFDSRTNALLVRDIDDNLAAVTRMARDLDLQTPQVLIEARIVEASTSYERQLGIQWGGSFLASQGTGNPTGLVFPSSIGLAGAANDGQAPTAGLIGPGSVNPNFAINLPAAIGTGSGGGLGLTLGSVGGSVSLALRLSALENTGQVKIISAPKITTLDNIEAKIEQGVSIPISVVSAAGVNTQFVDAILSLKVKPHVTAEGTINMDLQVTRNAPDFSQTGARGDPTIQKKEAKTQMLVRDGDTAVIGGIFTRQASVNYRKFPWLADIPIIGWLFKNRDERDDRSEMLIFITPRIVNRRAVIREQ